MRILPLFLHLPGIFLAYTIHEYIKARASCSLGDIKPKIDKRLSLNPAGHFELMGFICLFIWGVGWGKPVETHSFRYKDRKLGTLMVYLLPSVVNLFIGLIFGLAAFLTRMGFYEPVQLKDNIYYIIYFFLLQSARINISYAVFNIIPVYPLDGARVLAALKPAAGVFITRFEKVLQVMLMLMIFTGVIGASGLTGFISNTILSFAM